METMLRHWTLLRTVPRAPRKLDARSLTDRLREEGFDISKRTIERDLRKLSAAHHLAETPLTADQTRREIDGGRIETKAIVWYTQQLRWWLLAFGAGVEVVAPDGLRDELANELRRAPTRYEEKVHGRAVVMRVIAAGALSGQQKRRCSIRVSVPCWWTRRRGARTESGGMHAV